jgi:ribosome maturation factor RimP
MKRGDINKFVGKDVNVDFQESDGEISSASGKLVYIDDEGITIDYGEGVVDIQIVLIKRIELDK